MKDIIIFGAGNLGKQAYQKLCEDRKILAFCDNNENKQKELYCGLQVCSYGQLKENYSKDAINIVIASQYYIQIAKQIAGTFYSEGIFDPKQQKVVTLDDICSQTCYSLWGEDLFIKNTILPQKENPNEGFFVDIGGYHPILYSNTYGVYKSGWHGISIEPNPEAKEIFAEYRPRDINVSCGIANRDPGNMDYYMFEEPAYNGFFSEDTLKRIGSGKVKLLRKIEVPVCRLKDVLEQYKVEKIDVMSVDVEEMELDVLQSNDWEKYRPDWLLIEQLEVRNIEQSDVYVFLNQVGYELCCIIGVTVIYKIRK